MRGNPVENNEITISLKDLKQNDGCTVPSKTVLNYIEWNDAISKYFFNEEMAGREVILCVNEELIENIGKNSGSEFNDFIQSLKEGPDFIQDYDGNICRKAIQTYKIGLTKNFFYPPYIAYLALFVCAATKEGYNIQAYYPRLQDMVDDHSVSNMSLCFSGIDELWDHLTLWSLVLKAESLGRFRKMRKGNLAHVGLIYSQTVISEDERKKLPLVFSRANLDPTDPPSEETMRTVLFRFAHGILQSQRYDLLREDTELSKKLVQLVLAELEDWDGTISGILSKSSRDIFQNAYLRICLKEELGDIVSSSIRFKVNPEKGEFPEGDLEFKLKEPSSNNEQNFLSATCHETSQLGWSTPLAVSGLEKPRKIRAGEFFWNKKYVLEDSERKWQATWRGSDVKVFLPASRERLPDDWLEVQHIIFNSQFLVVCNGSYKNSINDWGRNSCDSFTERQTNREIPLGWSVFLGKNPKKPLTIIPELTLPDTENISIKFKGGITTKYGANYFLNFAPPMICVEGSEGNISLFFDGKETGERQGIENCWAIPQGLEQNLPHTIEIGINGEKLNITKTFWLVFPELTKDFSFVPRRNRNGEIIRELVNSEGYVQGALVFYFSNYPEAPLGAPTYLSHKIIFLGSLPGQICKWPDERLPTNWKPIWAIAKSGRKYWQIHFCGSLSDLKNVPPICRKNKDSRSIKLWKEYIWVNRKVNIYPRIRSLFELWKIYEECARNV